MPTSAKKSVSTTHKKSHPKPASAPHNETASEPAETVHTLPSLLAALGTATLEEARAFVEGHSDESLIHDGAKVATPRITTDAARMYGEAFDFLAVASVEQLDHLPTVTREWLRVAVWTAGEGDRLYGVLHAASAAQDASKASNRANADALDASIEAKRSQLHVALVAIAAGNAPLVAQAALAYGSATHAAAAVTTQTALARTWQAHGSTTVKARIKASRVTEAWLASADALAAQGAAATLAASATRSDGTTVTQANVDLLDGINLVLLHGLEAAMEAGHEATPTIPRVTFNALRRHVHRSHHAAPTTAPAATATPAAATTPATPAAPTAHA